MKKIIDIYSKLEEAVGNEVSQNTLTALEVFSRECQNRFYAARSAEENTYMRIQGSLNALSPTGITRAQADLSNFTVPLSAERIKAQDDGVNYDRAGE